jgi:hypothetical protein
MRDATSPVPSETGIEPLLYPLELLVEQYLTFAEFQARRGKPMRMADWQAKLDAFLRLNDCPILEHSGRISAARARAKAAREWAEYEARGAEGTGIAGCASNRV